MERFRLPRNDFETYVAAAGVVGVVYALTALLAPPPKASAKAKGAPAAEADPALRASFLSFRRAFVGAFAGGLACEYAVASQLFAATRASYPLVVVAELFAASYAATGLFRGGPRRSLEARLGRRSVCVLALVLYGASAAATAYACDREGAYGLLLASRAGAGAAAALLQGSFFAYAAAAHAHASFPSGWRREMFAWVGTASDAAPLLAGVGAEAAFYATGDRRAPLVAAALLALGAAAYARSAWPAAGADPPRTALCGGGTSDEGAFFEFPSGGSTEARGVVVVAASAALDASAYLALVAWAPVVARADRDAPFGVVYALTMAAAVVGTRVFSSIAAGGRPKFERLAAASCAVGGIAFAALSTTAVRATLGGALAPLLLFQGAVGASKPAFATLKARHVPRDAADRYASLHTALSAALALALTLVFPGHPSPVFVAAAALCGVAAPALAAP